MKQRTTDRRKVAGAGVLAAMAALVGSAARAQAPAAQGARLYLFQYAPGPAWRAGVAMREQGLGPHGAYMARLQREGRLFAGGGYASDDGGMAIVTAASEEEACAMLAADPAIESGIFVAQLREWRVRFRVETPLPR